MAETSRINFKAAGLGSNIAFLSLLIDSKHNIELITDFNSAETLRSLLRIFNQEARNIAITVTDEIINGETVHDSAKIFSPYLSTEQIRINGQDYWVDGKKDKPLVGFACYTNNDQWFDSSNKDFSFPYNKQYSTEYNSQIFRLIKESGYDVITLDSRDISLEQKIFTLNEMCDCVIGYEGGLHHLAHILNIPSIILPWHHTPAGDPKTYEFLHPHLYHLDRKTFFVEDDITMWSSDILKNIIKSLKENNGNNIFLNSNNPLTINLDKIQFESSGIDIGMPDMYKDIIRAKYNILLLGGEVPVINES